MSRVFAYCRVSKSELTVENQITALKKAGWDIPDHRIITETVSGALPAQKRAELSALLEHKLEPGDQLVVLKIDRLGRDAIDILQTIDSLRARDIRVTSLDMPVADMNSPEGRMMLTIISAFAEFERDRLRERTLEGLENARAKGRVLGRPKATETTRAVLNCKGRNMSQTQTAAELGLSITTIKRHWGRSLNSL